MWIAARILVVLFCCGLPSGLPGEDVGLSGSGLALDGQPVDPLLHAQTTVLVFVRTDCPISNRYAPEVRRLQQKFGSKGLAFWLVYCAPDESAEEIRRHMEEFDYRCRALRDPRHVLRKIAHATVTPEAAVFNADRQLLYHGRIDDLYADLSHRRPAPRTHDLEEVLSAVLRGEKVGTTYAPAVGCSIAPLP